VAKSARERLVSRPNHRIKTIGAPIHARPEKASTPGFDTAGKTKYPSVKEMRAQATAAGERFERTLPLLL
jgi:hypothetical protein